MALKEQLDRLIPNDVVRTEQVKKLLTAAVEESGNGDGISEAAMNAAISEQVGAAQVDTLAAATADASAKAGAAQAAASADASAKAGAAQAAAVAAVPTLIGDALNADNLVKLVLPGATTNGHPVRVGGVQGVAWSVGTAEPGIMIRIRGHSIPKASGVAFEIGDTVWWNNVTKQAVKTQPTVADSWIVGTASAAANASAGTMLVDVGVFSIDAYLQDTARVAAAANAGNRLVNVRAAPFRAQGNGATDDTSALQAAADSLSGVGGVLYIPSGTYYHTSPITVPANVTVRGDGNASILLCGADIIQIQSARVSDQANVNICLENFRCHDARTLDATTTRTNYQIRLTNPQRSRFYKVETSTNAAPTPSKSNLGGIHLEKLGAASAYINELLNCQVTNGQLTIETTDTTVMGGFYWSNNNPGAIWIKAGNVRVIGANIIPSSVNGGIYTLESRGSLGIVGCFFDGSNVPGVVTGHAINIDAVDTVISGNSFWYMSGSAVRITNGREISITGNSFADNNRSGLGCPDIWLQPASGKKINGVSINGNTFKNSIATTAKSYTIWEDESLGGTVRYGVIEGNVTSAEGNTGYLAPGVRLDSRTSAIAPASADYNRTLFAGNPSPWVTRNANTAYVLDAATSAIVTHGLSIQPLDSEIDIRPANANIGTRQAWVSNITATQFTINVSSAAAGSNIPIFWKARLGG